jgi:hypothetical protein
MSELLSADYTVGWIPASVSITAADKKALADERGVDPAKIRGHYVILGGQHKHPFIQRGLNLRKALNALKTEFLVPVADFVSAAAAGEHQLVRQSTKTYAIPPDSVESFRARFDDCCRRYLEWGRALSDPIIYHELRDVDRLAIAESWSVIERRYPTPDELAAAVYCTVPNYAPISSDFSRLPPDLAAQLRQEADARLTATLQNIESNLLLQFQGFIESVRRSCGNVVKVYPEVGSEWAQYREAEVLEQVGPLKDADIPEGHQRYKLRTEAGEVNTLVLSDDVFQLQFKPRENGDTRRLTEPAFANLLGVTEKIGRFRNQLRSTDDKEFLAAFAERVQSTLESVGNTPSDIVNALRSDGGKRADLTQAFDGLLDEFRESGTVARAIQFHTRRRILATDGD